MSDDSKISLTYTDSDNDEIVVDTIEEFRDALEENYTKFKV